MAETSPPGSSSTSPPEHDDASPAPLAVRTIPNEDTVSRHIFAPRMIGPAAEFVWAEVFQFPASEGLAESVAWRAVASSDSEVHSLGCDKQARDRARAEAKGQTGPTYRGFINANVGAIRSQRVTSGHRFSVTHAPAEGDWHGEVAVVLAAGTTKLSKQDKQDVRAIMEEVFGNLNAHTCP